MNARRKSPKDFKLCRDLSHWPGREGNRTETCLLSEAALHMCNLTQAKEHSAIPRVALGRSRGWERTKGWSWAESSWKFSKSSPLLRATRKGQVPREPGQEVQALLCGVSTAPPEQRCRKTSLSLLVPNATVKLAILARSGGAEMQERLKTLDPRGRQRPRLQDWGKDAATCKRYAPSLEHLVRVSYNIYKSLSGLLLPQFYRWSIWSLKRLSQLPHVNQMISGEVKIRARSQRNSKIILFVALFHHSSPKAHHGPHSSPACQSSPVG